MIFRTFLYVGLWMALMAMAVQSAHAYNWNKCRNNKQVWESNTVTFSPSEWSFPFLSDERASLEAMRTAWNSAPGTRFVFNFVYDDWGGHYSGDLVNSILITDDYNWGSTTLAVAIRRHQWCTWPFWGGKLREADVLFNADVTWDFSTNPEIRLPWRRPRNLALVGIHELGHAIGLNHEDDVMATMNSIFPNSGPIGGDNDVVPHGDDVLGNRAGYGTSGSPRDVYVSAFERTGAGHSDEIDAPDILYSAAPTHFKFTIGNRGTIHETSVGVKFYLSTDRTISSSDHLVGSAGFTLNQGATVTHTVSVTAPSGIAAGDYYFGWIVDPDGQIAEVDEGNNSIALPNRTSVSNLSPPSACFTVTPTFGYAPLIVFVNAACSSDADGSITSYTWDMGDGITRTGQSFSHLYAAQGFYTIGLTVRDNSNLTDQAFTFVDVFCSDQDGGIGDPGNPCLEAQDGAEVLE